LKRFELNLDAGFVSVLAWPPIPYLLRLKSDTSD